MTPNPSEEFVPPVVTLRLPRAPCAALAAPWAYAVQSVSLCAVARNFRFRAFKKFTHLILPPILTTYAYICSSLVATLRIELAAALTAPPSRMTHKTVDTLSPEAPNPPE